MKLTSLVIVREKSCRTSLARGIIQEKLVNCAGDASPTAFLFLPSGLEVLKHKDKDCNLSNGLQCQVFVSTATKRECVVTYQTRALPTNWLIATPWPEPASELYRPSDRRL
jgi:hypothetical protein